MRKTLTTLTITLATIVLLLNAPAARAFDYPSPKVDINDLSFYQPPISTEPYPLTTARKVRNVIICIGDGMGLSQVTLARLRATGPAGKLHMERLPVSGIIRTHSSDHLVTDSAAAGTALSSGIKTKNGMIGQGPDGSPYRTILEAAQASGMATGLVATSTITHATPASFASHVKSRKMEPDIAEQLLANRVNVLLSGGRKFFLPKSDPNSGRDDERDLVAEAREAGYAYAETAWQLRSVNAPYLLGLFQYEGLTTSPPEPMLALMTRKAIQCLRNARDSAPGPKKGFFLMVEGSQIDWACHSNDADSCVRQTLLFDEAVKVAIDFALADGRTLLIVTADHETGGLTIADGSLKGTDAKVKWSTDGHTGTPVPVFALGPNAERFAGVYDNTEITKRLAPMLGIRPWPQPME
ncbi:MAG: alkaline phosphatase [Phycisphaerales bacterium]|nr:MAG: alkaline phosphatase [Phycisphaerales bacterium]